MEGRQNPSRARSLPASATPSMSLYHLGDEWDTFHILVIYFFFFLERERLQFGIRTCREDEGRDGAHMLVNHLFESEVEPNV